MEYARMDLRLDLEERHPGDTADAAWMGVPTIAIGGGSGAPLAQSVAWLNGVLGLGELNRVTPANAGVEAATLAGDHPRLARLRASLRQRLQGNAQALGIPAPRTGAEPAP